MRKYLLLFIVCFLLIMAETQAQSKPRYYLVHSSCFCDPDVHSVSSDAKPKQHLFISNVQTASSENSSQNDRNESKLKDKFRSQVKIEFENWTEILLPIFVEDFSTAEEASDFRREKMADEKTQRKAQFHIVSI